MEYHDEVAEGEEGLKILQSLCSFLFVSRDTNALSLLEVIGRECKVIIEREPSDVKVKDCHLCLSHNSLFPVSTESRLNNSQRRDSLSLMILLERLPENQSQAEKRNYRRRKSTKHSTENPHLNNHVDDGVSSALILSLLPA